MYSEELVNSKIQRSCLPSVSISPGYSKVRPGVIFFCSLSTFFAMLLLILLPLILAAVIGRDFTKPDTGYIDNNFNE